LAGDTMAIARAVKSSDLRFIAGPNHSIRTVTLRRSVA
jgi:hypothetical protein